MREKPAAVADTPSAQGPGAATVEALPPLLREGAFVVQFREGAGPAYFAGRVEHIDSARAAQFDSSEGLLAYVTEVLAQVRDQEIRKHRETEKAK